MQVTCPVCFARFALEAALTDADARRAVQAAAQLPEGTGMLVLAYAGLFRTPERALTWKRAASIIEAVSKAIKSGRVARGRVEFPAPRSLWIQALEQMLARRDKLDMPLTGHGYLRATVFALAQRAHEHTPQYAGAPRGEGLRKISEAAQHDPLFREVLRRTQEREQEQEGEE